MLLDGRGALSGSSPAAEGPRHLLTCSPAGLPCRQACMCLSSSKTPFTKVAPRIAMHVSRAARGTAAGLARHGVPPIVRRKRQPPSTPSGLRQNTKERPPNDQITALAREQDPNFCGRLVATGHGACEC